MVERALGRKWTVIKFGAVAVAEGVGWSVEPVLDVAVARTFDVYARRRKTLDMD